jgi:hypothetical protein
MVAIELAAWWNPFRKSNASAIALQQCDRLMRNVAGLLPVALDVPAPQLELADVLEQRFELRGGEHRQAGVLVEEIEELSFTAQKAGHRGLYSQGGAIIAPRAR